MPKVSIITVYYNRAHLAKRTIQSILDQSYDDFELIVVDDGSSDELEEVVAIFKDDRIRFYRKENSGFTNTIKWAVEVLAKGEYIAIQGSGDISQPNRIEAQINILKDRSDVGLVGCGIRFVRESPPAEFDYFPDTRSEILEKSPIMHGEVMFRLSIYKEVGGYREFFRYCQDYDLWLRMSRVCLISAVPEILYIAFQLQESVSGKWNTRIMQMYYQDVARQSAKNVIKGGSDWINDGHYAWVCRKRNYRLSMNLLKIAKVHLLKEDYYAVRNIVRFSRREKYNILNILFSILIAFDTKRDHVLRFLRKVVLMIGS